MKKNESIYLYDGSFINLLNLIVTLIQHKIIPYNIKEEEYNPNLLDNLIMLEIKNDETIIKKVLTKFSIYSFNIIYKLYLSNHRDKELLIYYFFLYHLKYKTKIYAMRNISIINECLKTSKYVGREAHKMKGFLRFQELQNKVLYAKMSPENNILPLLVTHFKKRLPKEYWVIHDVKRNLVAMYNQKEIEIKELKDKTIKLNDLSREEQEINELWKNFYQTTGIQERKNDRCRRNFMPKKYWQYITEVREEQ